MTKNQKILLGAAAVGAAYLYMKNRKPVNQFGGALRPDQIEAPTVAAGLYRPMLPPEAQAHLILAYSPGTAGNTAGVYDPVR